MRVPLLILALIPSLASAQTFLGKADSVWLKELQQGDAKQRRSAAFALGRIGRAALDVLQSLTAALQDGDGAVRDSAAFALAQIAEHNADRVWQHAGDDLLARLKDDDARVRRSAAVALGSCKA